MSDAPPEPRGPAPGAGRAPLTLGVVVLTTLAVMAVSYLPVLRPHSDTLVGLIFLAVTYWMVLRHDAESVRRHGLSLGGLFEPEPLEARRLLRSAGAALAWAFGLALLVFPGFWLGWLAWWKPASAFAPAGLEVLRDGALAHLLAVALPEEAFYRGYAQSAFDEVWTPRRKLLGACVGPSIVVTSALFALGHLATDFDVNRLGVFFPSLLFGWLRARTGGVGAPIVFHALCNLFADFLARSYGFGP